MDITVYKPNPAVAAALMSPATRAKMEELANTAKMLYQARVAKRSGRLAASARAHVEVGGKNHDRWIAELTIGGTGAAGTVDYALPHEFGVKRDVEGPTLPGSGGRAHTGGHDAAHDLNAVLAELGSY